MKEVTFLEQHYSIKEVAPKLGVGIETVRKLVMNEPGVVRLSLGCGARMTYRIPQSVLDRLMRRSANPAAPHEAA